MVGALCALFIWCKSERFKFSLITFSTVGKALGMV